MGMGCCAKIAQIVLIIFNLVIFVIGLAMIGVAIGLKIATDDVIGWLIDIVGEVLDWGLLAAAFYVMLGVGIFLMLVGFFGCCGALKRSNCLLCVYIILVLVILTLQVIGGVLVAVFIGYLDFTIETAMKDSVQNDYATGQAVTTSWDNMQFELECCGGSNYTDYVGSYYTSSTGNSVPQACCTAATRENGDIILDNDDWVICKADASLKATITGTFYTQGCYDSWHTWITSNTDVLIGVLVGLGIIEILIVLFACCVIKEDDSFV